MRRKFPGSSIDPTPDCGGPHKPPGATEFWWCEEHQEFHGSEHLLELDQAGAHIITVPNPNLMFTQPELQRYVPEALLDQARGIARDLLEATRGVDYLYPLLRDRIDADPGPGLAARGDAAPPGLAPWAPIYGHRHGSTDPQPHWREHSHLGGGEPHTHDLETGLQVPVGEVPGSPKGDRMSEVLWAVDLDEDGRPWRAHEVIARERQPGGARITACGQRRTPGTHPRGWWSARKGRLPSAERMTVNTGTTRLQFPVAGVQLGGPPIWLSWSSAAI